MELAKFFETEGRGSLSRLAKDIGAFASDVSDWAKKNRPIPLKFCAQIETHTRGQVTRQELRPDDWQIHWPELARKKKKA